MPAAAALLLALTAVLGYRFLMFEVLGPKAAVEEYLAALVEGDSAAATALLPASSALVVEDPQVYGAAGERITGFTIRGQQIRGGEAVVHTEIVQGGETSAVDFTLLADGERFMLFRNWEHTRTAARTVALTLPSGVAEIRINGRPVELPADGPGTVEVQLLPGSYTLQGPEDRFLSYGPPHAVVVKPGMPGDPDPVRLYASVTAELAAEVQARGDTYLQACLDRKETAPASCPNAAYATGDPDRYREARWTLEKPPAYRIVGTPETGLAAYATGGKARVTYQEDATGKGNWENRSDVVNIPFGSELALSGNDLLLDFRP